LTLVSKKNPLGPRQSVWVFVVSAVGFANQFAELFEIFDAKI